MVNLRYELAHDIEMVADAFKEGSHTKILQQIAEIAREVLGADIALVTMIDEDQSHHLARVGTDIESVPRKISISAEAVVSKSLLVIPDMQADPRWQFHYFAQNPPFVRFYAAAPIILSSGTAIGTVSVMGAEPRSASSTGPVGILTRLAQVVSHSYELLLKLSEMRVESSEDPRSAVTDEFLKLVSHELRTPLNGIVGLSSCFEPDTDEEVELVAALSHSARHLTAIVDSILTYSEMNSEGLALDETNFDPDKLIAQTISSFEPLAHRFGKNLKYTPDTETLSVTADAVKLELALSCLLSNGLVHGGPGVSVKLAQNPLGQSVIEVIDNGAGISADRIDAVQEPFVVGSDVITRTAGGVGLGLPLARRIVELQGGELQFAKERDSFVARIVLPAWRVTGPH